MAISEFLYPILSAGAVLVAQSATGEFAKSAGKEAFEKLKALLSGKHRLKNLDLLERVAETPALEGVIIEALNESTAGEDPEVNALAQAVLAELKALPASVPVAIDVEKIEAAGHQIFKDVAGGIRAKTITSGGDQAFVGITAPKK